MTRQTHFSRGRKGFWISVGVVVTGVWLAVVLLVAVALKPALKSGKHPPQVAGTPAPAQPSPSPAPLPGPAAQPSPPPVPAVQPSPPTSTVAKTPAAPERAKRRSPHLAVSEPIKGPGAESLAAARKAFSAGDYIASGIQARRAARQGAGLPAFLLVGDSMLRLESYPEAQQAYQSALEIEPSSARAKRGLRLAKRKTSD